MGAIKQIFDEIANEPSTKKKMELLAQHKNDELLKRVLYLANSKRVKFYIKQIPEYPISAGHMGLDSALNALDELSSRKVTGHSAIGHLVHILASVSADDAYIIERIIDKDCKIGMKESNINKVFDKLIEETPYMGAKPFEEKAARKIFDKGAKGASQIKMDGRYCNAICRGGEVELESRSGEPTFVGDAAFLQDLKYIDNVVLNGELTIDGVHRYTANGMVASIVDIEGKRGERGELETIKKIKAFEDKHGSYADALNKIRYTVWDVIDIDEYFNQYSSMPYRRRLEILEGIIFGHEHRDMKVSIIETRIVSSYEEAISHFQEALANGEEGTILKAYDGHWKDGKPNWQVKMKLEMDVDLKIVGFNYGTAGTKNEHLISSFNAESSCGLVKTRPQGLPEDIMEYVTANQDKLLGGIIECKSCGLSSDSKGNYSLLHPAFTRIRDDKNTCDSLETIKAIEAMAKGLTTA